MAAFVALAAALTIGLGGWLAALGLTAPPPGRAPTPAPSAGLPAPLRGSIGRPVDVAGLRVTVLSSGSVSRQAFPAAPPGQARLLAVRVRFENTGGGQVPVSPSDFAVTDSAGRVFQGTPLGGTDDLPERQLGAGQSVVGRVGFVLAAGAGGLVLHYESEVGNQSMVVPLS